MTPATHRVYFALWPDAVTRARLAAAVQPAASAVGGRAVAAESLHVTLAFVGAVSVPILGALARLGAAIAWPAGTLRLDVLEWWSGPRVAVLCASSAAAPLLSVRASLCDRLAALGIEIEPTPFRPHLTIARDVRAAPASTGAAVDFEATHVALVESTPTPGEPSRYRPLAAWATQAAAPGFQVI
jgi:2'-5' RNA ligase